MKKTLLLALGLFAAAAFAQVVPPDAVKPTPADAAAMSAPDPLAIVEKERDALKAQLNDVIATSAALRQQRNELAAQVLDLAAAIQVLQQKLQQAQAAPPPAPAK